MKASKRTRHKPLLQKRNLPNKKLAEQYKNVSAVDIVEETHLKNLPRHRVYKEENKPYDLIPYQYAIDTEKDAYILELAKESKEMKDAYR